MAVIEAIIKLRRGSASAWTTANPTLASGEEGYETDTGRTKRGDGSTPWNSLAYTDTASKIFDSTAVGRSILTAANADAIQVILGIDAVDNTPDTDKPVSVATANAIAASQTTALGRAVAFSIAL